MDSRLISRAPEIRTVKSSSEQHDVSSARARRALCNLGANRHYNDAQRSIILVPFVPIL